MKFHHAFFHNFRRKLAINVVLGIGSLFMTPGLLAQSHGSGASITLTATRAASDGQCTAPSNGEDYSGVQCSGVTDDSTPPTASMAAPLIAFDAGEDYSGPQAATPLANTRNANYGQSAPVSGGVK